MNKLQHANTAHSTKKRPIAPKWHRPITDGPNKGCWVITEEFRQLNLNEFSMARSLACREEAAKLEAVGKTVVIWNESYS